MGKDDFQQQELSQWSPDFIQKLQENELYQSIAYYYDWVKQENRLWDERISKLVFEINESLRMEEADKESFNTFNSSHMGNVELYLAGHIHEYAGEDEEKKLVASKFLNDATNSPSGYVISILKQDEDGKRFHSRRFKDVLFNL